jgi:hypothetical protein
MDATWSDTQEDFHLPNLRGSRAARQPARHSARHSARESAIVGRYVRRVAEWRDALRTGWALGPWTWSFGDVAMVLGWTLAMPYAARGFERDILLPPLAHLSQLGNFGVAFAMAVLELAAAALVARMLGRLARVALRDLGRTLRLRHGERLAVR